VVVSNSYAFGGNNASLVLARCRPRTLARRSLVDEGAVITGIGLIGRPGIGAAEWEKTLAPANAGPPLPLTDTAITERLAAEPFAAAAAWRQMNGFTRLCLAAARLAVEDARLPLTRDRRDGIGLILGTMSGPAHLAPRRDQAGRRAASSRSVHEFTQVTLNTPAGSVCQALAIRGITTTITSGGASGTLALEAALDAIRLGRAQAIVVVTAEVACPEVAAIYRSLGILAPDGDLLPYDARQRGTACGTAAVALVVEAAGAARRRDAPARGAIAAIAHRSDGYHQHRFDPGGTRYGAAIRGALARASVTAADIGLITGSATGTGLDRCEQAALAAVFPTGTPVTAMKAMTGECEAASGLVNVALPLLLRGTGTVQVPAFRLGDLGGDATPVRSPADCALATAVSFGGTFGAVVLDRRIP
jgi:3-oxoacyl-[acyl-carrier-protein] synthase II